jgi:MoxR-like ATPase
MSVSTQRKRKAPNVSSKKQALIGRSSQIDHLTKCIKLSRNILIEGAVGVGKTFLVQSVLRNLKLAYERVDGDSRYTEQKLTGWFDPPIVLKKGYQKDAFIDGPLVTAMREGRILFVNELNRMPEAVQNILLPAMDERRIGIPKLGEITAKTGFLVVATQNPREFTATHVLSEALLDRFEMIRLEYQTHDEEKQIVLGASGEFKYLERAVDLVRSTRNHPSIKRGASVRAAIAIVDLAKSGIEFKTACLMALPGRIECVSSEEDPESIIKALLNNLEPSQSNDTSIKKKDLRN